MCCVCDSFQYKTFTHPTRFTKASFWPFTLCFASHQLWIFMVKYFTTLSNQPISWLFDKVLLAFSVFTPGYISSWISTQPTVLAYMSLFASKDSFLDWLVYKWHRPPSFSALYFYLRFLLAGSGCCSLFHLRYLLIPTIYIITFYTSAPVLLAPGTP